MDFEGVVPGGCKGGGKSWGKGGDFGKAGIVMPWQKGAAPYGKGGGDYGKGGGKDAGWGASDYKPGQYCEEPGGHVGIEGLKDAVTRACEPHAILEQKWGRDDMVNKVCMSIFKTATKWYKEDTRHKETGTAIQAQALLEEFTEKIMGALSSACYDKPWFLELYLSESVALAAINTFKTGALFKRTVAPIIVTHVDEAIFRYREEERHTRVMWDAISSVGFKSDYLKKANKHLMTSFEAAHISAKYGTSPSTSPELGMVQDFVTAWLHEFAKRAWDVLNNGINDPQPIQQMQVVTTLFQYLCDPAHSCLPHDLTSQLATPPPVQWEFVAAATIQMFNENQ